MKQSPHSDKPILVVGATGTVGREVVRALLERGARVRVFVRNLDGVAHLNPDVERAVGTLEDPQSITRALQGVQAAFYVSPHEQSEETLARNFLTACEAARVRLVFAGVHIDGKSWGQRAALRTLFGLMLPHYRPKMRLAERIRTSSLHPVVLVPGNFFQNEDLCLPEIRAGLYPMPLGRIGRIDTRDVGDAAARALMDHTVPGGAYTLTTPHSSDGTQAAETWSAALGRAVCYRPDLEMTDLIIDRECSGQKAVDFKKTFKVFQNFKRDVSPAEATQTTFLLGRPPRTHAEYVRDTLQARHVQAAD